MLKNLISHKDTDIILLQWVVYDDFRLMTGHAAKVNVGIEAGVQQY
jgi:hypothetical protein